MADNTEKPRYVSHLSDESYEKFLASPEAECVRRFYRGFSDTIVKRAWKDAGYRWAEENAPTAFLEMQCDNIREQHKDFLPSVVESIVNKFRREHGLEPANLIGYRADREPDASWYRPSNHRPPSQGEIEYRRREEERINKIKSSWGFKWRRFFAGNLYDTEAEADEATLKLIEEKEREIPRNPPPGGWAPFK